MRFLILVSLAISSFAFGAETVKKSTLTATKEQVCKIVNGKNECTVKEAKTKVCKTVNGKEECTIEEVKNKALELKNSVPGL